MIQPLVSVLTINFNGKDHLETFLPSLFQQELPGESFELVLVDNGSTDGSVAWVREHYPQVRLVENTGNNGFAKANNQGAAVAHGRYLALLNNDMHLAPGWLATMVAAREAGGPETVCVGSRILDWDGGHVDFIASGMAFHGMGFQLDHGVPTDSPAGRQWPEHLLFACGGAMLVDREVYLAVGGLDEDFFAYYEDVDFGWRLWVLGYRVAFCGEAVAHHRHNATSSRFGAHKKQVLLERNALYAMVKNYEQAHMERLLNAALLLTIKRAAVRSGLDRRDWAFTLTSQPVPALPAEAPMGPAALFMRALSREGLKPAMKKALVKSAEHVIRRWGRPAQAPLSTGVAIAPEAYAGIVALEDLMDHLPRLLEKRSAIQQARKRPDAAIFPLFKLPFQAVEGRGDYIPVHTVVLDALGVKDLFEQAAPAPAEQRQ